MVGAWRGMGGGKDGRRRGYAVAEESLQCAILAQFPLLAFIVNMKSMPQQPLFFSLSLQSLLQFPSRIFSFLHCQFRVLDCSSQISGSRRARSQVPQYSWTKWM